MVQQQQAERTVCCNICLVVIDGNGSAIEVSVHRQTSNATSHIEAWICGIIRTSWSSIDDATKPTTRRGDAIVEFCICRGQTERRSADRNDHHVCVVNDGFEARRRNVVEETIEGKGPGERRRTTRRHQDVKRISLCISS